MKGHRNGPGTYHLPDGSRYLIYSLFSVLHTAFSTIHFQVSSLYILFATFATPFSQLIVIEATRTP